MLWGLSGQKGRTNPPWQILHHLLLCLAGQGCAKRRNSHPAGEGESITEVCHPFQPLSIPGHARRQLGAAWMVFWEKNLQTSGFFTRSLSQVGHPHPPGGSWEKSLTGWGFERGTLWFRAVLLECPWNSRGGCDTPLPVLSGH